MELTTEVEGLTLRSHRIVDAEPLAHLLCRDARHLLSHGDYAHEIATTVREWRDLLAAQDAGDEPAYSFGMRARGPAMVGRIVLVPVDPPHYSVGYWVAESQQGKGFATASVRAILPYAASLGAADAVAGVLHGNAASRRVLEHAGFVKVADFPRTHGSGVLWLPSNRSDRLQTGAVERDSPKKTCRETPCGDCGPRCEYIAFTTVRRATARPRSFHWEGKP